MSAKHFSYRMIASGLALAFWMTPASAETFEPLKFLQSGSVAAAIATAVAELDDCEEDLIFSQEKKKGDNGDTITVTVDCKKYPGDDDKFISSAIKIEFELNQDGSVGVPYGFSYE